jgi:hypothetical protein
MRIAAACLALALIATSPLGAVTVLPATFEELVRESVSVVHGRVAEVRGRWTADRRTIESVVTLEVAEVLKGTDVEATTFVVPGGTAGDRILVMPGAPVFRAGDDVVVFLRGRAPALPQPVGLALGVYRVANGPDGVARVMPSPITTAAVPGRVARGAASRPVRTLAAFSAEVRAVEARP